MGLLIVDDSPDNRLPLKAILGMAGYKDLRTADSARDAFRQLGMDGAVDRPTSIDVILMDIMMPDMDGIEACRRIKAVDRLRDIPVIMVTSQTEMIEAAFAAGAMDYIMKPVNVLELLARLRSALTLKREMDWRKRREQELLRATHDLEQMNRKLQRLSSLDGLTGIANRRYFDYYLRRAWKHAARTGMPLSLVLMDIDFFKVYNDTYGHLLGDECLKEVARALSHRLHRPADVAARFGGEEFAAILVETDAQGAGVVAEGLRDEVEGLGIAHVKSPLGGRVTVSVGAATMMPSAISTPESLIAASDQALYRAKEAGRNLVRQTLAQERSAPVAKN